MAKIILIDESVLHIEEYIDAKYATESKLRITHKIIGCAYAVFNELGPPTAPSEARWTGTRGQVENLEDKNKSRGSCPTYL